MAIDWSSFFSLVLGSGAVFTLATLVYNWRASVNQQDFQARQDGKNYYLTMYGHVNILFELGDSYVRAMKSQAGGKTEGFTFKKCGFVERTAAEILNEFNDSYQKFSLFYIENKRDGKEMFISKKFSIWLTSFWALAMKFYASIQTMDEEKRSEFISKFTEAFNETTKSMQKLYGLK